MIARHGNIDSTVLGLADNSTLIQILSGLNSQPISNWLPAAHRARTGQLLNANGNQFKKFRQVKNSFTDAELRELLVVSGPNHCMDGWSYLARAFSALSSRDYHAVRHLSYYSQLRAALSILATIGIGIFNGVNFVVDVNGDIHHLHTTPENKRAMGTHIVAWEALIDWVEEPNNADYMLSVLKIGHASLKDCIISIWPGTMTVSIAAPLIKVWGLDLERGLVDRGSRNISSYAVHELNPLDGKLISDMKFVKHMWSLLQPSGGAGFDNLDIFLLRNILCDIHEKTRLNKNYANGAISQRYGSLPQSVQNIASLEFLTKQRSKSKPLFLRKANSKRKTDPLSMLSRATLLLRVATAFNTEMFKQASFSNDGSDLHRWLHPIGVQRGFWKDSDPLDTLGELWNEISYAIDDLSESISPLSQSLQATEWIMKERTGFPILSQMERAGMWGLCP